MVQLILWYVRLTDWQYAGLLRFGIAYVDVTARIFRSSGCGPRYLNELSQEREQLQGQLDRLQVRTQMKGA